MLTVSDEAKYASVLAALLMIPFVIGNIINPSQQTLSVFPWLAQLFAFPVVLCPAISAIGIRRHGKSITILQGLLIGETISHWAALLFAVVVAGYTYFHFEHYRPWFIAFLLTAVVTWLTGLVFSLLCIFFIFRRCQRRD